MKRKSFQSRSCSFWVEKLETRNLLAGNVKVFVSDATLFIQGDGASNGVVVRQTDIGAYTISGFSLGNADTSINGSTSVKLFTGVRNDINVNLSAGNDAFIMGDSLVNNQSFASSAGGGTIPVSPFIANSSTTHPLRAAVPRNLIANMGDGNDHVSLNVNVGGANFGGIVNLITGNGNDRVRVEQSYVHDDLLITSGNGNDYASVQNSRITDLLFADLGAGSDQFNGNQYNAGHASINTGVDSDVGVDISNSKTTLETIINTANGYESVSLNNYTTLNGSLQIAGSEGAQIVKVQSSNINGSLIANTGAGNDQVTLSNVVVKNDISILLGDGSDSLTLTKNTATNAILRGGANYDSFHNGVNNQFGNVDIAEFEQSDVIII